MGIFLVGAIVLPLAYAEDDEIEIGTRFIPSILVEESEAVIQVYVTQEDEIVPQKISDIVATSLDSSILKVVDVIESDSSFVAELIVKTGEAGDTIISIAAPGISSVEIPITVESNKLTQKQLVLKTIPDIFTVEKNNFGMISVQLSDEDGFPVVAKDDLVVTLSSSDTNIVNIPQRDIVIKSGSYFAIGELEIGNEGTADVYASAIGLESSSEEITVEEEDELIVELYVFPETLNAHTASKGHIVAQLQKSGGEPVIAKEDIRVDLRITNEDFSESSNTSDDLYNSIQTTGYFEIKKGSYWGYATFASLTGIEDSYDVVISSRDPFSTDTISFETKDVEFFDNKIVQFETVPILATGNEELIGFVYLEDDGGDPIKASENINVIIDSSDEAFLRVPSVIIQQGSSSAPVYAKVGNAVPDDIELLPRIPESVIETPEVYGPDKDTLELIVTPMVSDILAGSTFPVALYLEDAGDVTPFTENSEVFVSPSEYFKIEDRPINQGENIVIYDVKSLEKGEDDVYFTFEDYESSVSLTSVSSSISNVKLDYSENIFAGSNDIFSIQLLNENDLPVIASEDIEIQFVQKDNTILEFPETVTIKQGEHYSTFDVAAKKTGMSELSLLGNEIPLTTYEIQVDSLVPEITISAPDMIEEDDAFDAQVKVIQNGSPLQGSKVSWNVEGGLVQIGDKQTGTDGVARLSLIGIDEKAVKISAEVSGAWFPPTSVSKSVRINSTSSEFMAFAEEGSSSQYNQIEIFGFDPVLIIVPLGIGIGAFYLKKNGMLKIKETQA